MKKRVLSDICEISSGGTPSRSVTNYYQGELPWAKISDIEKTESGFIYDTEEKISKEGLKSIRNKTFPAGTLLFAMYGSIGKVAIAGREMSTNQAILGIKPKDPNQLNVKYLKLWFELNKQKLIDQGRGAAIKNLSATIIRNLEITLPPLDEQIQIANLLTKVEKIIVSRKASIKALDELVKSTFIEMFGFNGTDYRQWKVEPLYTNTEIVSGVTKGKKYKSSNIRTIPYLRVANVQDGYLDLKEVKTLQVTDYEIQQYMLQKDDLLLTEGGDPDKLGRCAVWNDEIDECIHQNHIFRVRVKDKSVNPFFLCALIGSRYGKSYFLKAAKQTTGIASINSTQVKLFPLIKPPLSLQNQFAAIVEKIAFLKLKYTNNLNDLENLYSTLSQLAFQGNLDLSKIPIKSETEIEIGEITGIYDAASRVKSDFTKEDLLDLIKRYSGKTFSFDEIWKQIEVLVDKKMPSRHELQDQIIELLQVDSANFKQVFDTLSSHYNNKNVEKQIAFRGNYEN